MRAMCCKPSRFLFLLGLLGLGLAACARTPQPPVPATPQAASASQLPPVMPRKRPRPPPLFQSRPAADATPAAPAPADEAPAAPLPEGGTASLPPAASATQPDVPAAAVPAFQPGAPPPELALLPPPAAAAAPPPSLALEMPATVRAQDGGISLRARLTNTGTQNQTLSARSLCSIADWSITTPSGTVAARRPPAACPAMAATSHLEAGETLVTTDRIVPGDTPLAPGPYVLHYSLWGIGAEAAFAVE